MRYARNCCATGSLNVLNPTPAFVLGKPTSQSRGKFTEIPRFGYMFVNLELRDICIIPEIALEDEGSGQHLLCAFAALREIILAQGFDRA